MHKFTSANAKEFLSVSLLANLEGSSLSVARLQRQSKAATPSAARCVCPLLPWNQATNFPRRRCRDLTLQPPRCNLRSTRERFTAHKSMKTRRQLLPFNCRARAPRTIDLLSLSLEDGSVWEMHLFSHANAAEARAFTWEARVGGGRAVLNARAELMRVKWCVD